jgi:hypothetical protein
MVFKKNIMLFVACFLSFVAQAETVHNVEKKKGEVQKYVSRVDQRGGMDARIDKMNLDLKDMHQKIMNQAAELDDITSLKGRASAVQKAHDAFLNYRNVLCDAQRMMAEPGTGAADIMRRCQERVTKQHIKFLRHEHEGLFPKKEHKGKHHQHQKH